MKQINDKRMLDYMDTVQKHILKRASKERCGMSGRFDAEKIQNKNIFGLETATCYSDSGLIDSRGGGKKTNNGGKAKEITK